LLPWSQSPKKKKKRLALTSTTNIKIKNNKLNLCSQCHLVDKVWWLLVVVVPSLLVFGGI